ncbi:dual specificity protein [Lynx pardinus]|uniref:Dual specificity protein n=1 Tax=Lynx pardinus TaxID=191816 RepID=A0A485PDC7_LYNPA|nr:dual specificity protein [Lynx pardinus]
MGSSCTPRTFPVRFQQPSVSGLSQITSSLYISNGVAANNKLMVSSNRITTVINVPVEVVNTLYEDIRYVQVPVADAPISRLCDFFDPTADHIHSVAMKQGRTLLRCWREPLSCSLPCLPHEVPCHVPAGRPHVDQVMPAHHPAQQWLLGAAHPL